ncbi:MAG TPA: amidohydrolase [Mycobacteriales bacterium]|jgi:amidohydrolase|nr:amidohydrolase [Mycobacteriales bacterium]
MGVEEFLAEHGESLVELRRDLHAHPELGWQEHRTTARIVDELTAAGLAPRTLPGGTGVICDIGPSPVVGLRADIDALPVMDGTAASYRSTMDGVSHACGHDVHATVVVGAGRYLASLAAAGRLPRGVRLLFQPAEELMPGGALELIEHGGLDGLERVFAVHCDPSIEVGRVGLRVGPVTSATDQVEVRLSGPGGHTARPHRTADLVSAIGEMVSRVPGVLARRVDPRAGVNLVWGEVHAGSAANVIPRSGVATGTLRMLDRNVWESVPTLLAATVRDVVAPYGVEVEITHTRGVPPVVNDALPVAELHAAAKAGLGDMAACDTEQSLGGEDFGWLLEKVPGALARLGVRRPGDLEAVDLHQPTFDVDERCIGVGVRLLVGVCLS